MLYEIYPNTAEFDDEFGDPAMFVDRAYTSLKKKHAAARAAAFFLLAVSRSAWFGKQPEITLEALVG